MPLVPGSKPSIPFPSPVGRTQSNIFSTTVKHRGPRLLLSSTGTGRFPRAHVSVLRVQVPKRTVVYDGESGLVSPRVPSGGSGSVEGHALRLHRAGSPG